MEFKHLILISTTIAFLNGFFFFFMGLNEIIGIFCLSWCLVTVILNNKQWYKGFKEKIGYSLFGGLTVSIIKDINTIPLNEVNVKLYFIGFGLALFLLIPSASENEII